MMTQVDEITREKHLNMNFTEFIEAICRVADKVCIPNILKESFNPEESLGPEDI